MGEFVFVVLLLVSCLALYRFRLILLDRMGVPLPVWKWFPFPYFPFFLCVAIFFFVTVWGSLWLIDQASKERLYDNVVEIPARDVGVVLGTSERLTNGAPNLYFKHRIDAAVQLYRAGKVRHLIVSGDNSDKYYDEPSQMRAALVAQGVPNRAITSDYAGFRTLDSVVRAKKVFGQARVTLISQRFHNQRAIFIANHSGVDAIGFNAADVHGSSGRAINVREVFARVKAVLDVFILSKQPKFLGPPIDVPLEQNGTL